jgi:hypothetical protein
MLNNDPVEGLATSAPVTLNGLLVEQCDNSTGSCLSIATKSDFPISITAPQSMSLVLCRYQSNLKDQEISKKVPSARNG